MVNHEETLKLLPETPGVYIYRNAEGKIIYIGKAKNLKRRVLQYFRRDDAVGEKTAALVSEIANIRWQQTLTEFDAILLESQLIRKYQPKYNVISKDDKSPIYLAITKEPLPRILFVRKRVLSMYPKAKIFGPFQSSFFLRMLMYRIRDGIPYCLAKQRNGRPCFYTHIGRCAPCPSEIVGLPEGERKTALSKEYRDHIRKIVAVLSGKGSTVVAELTREMEKYAADERFEDATRIRNMLSNLNRSIMQTYDPEIYMSGDFVREKLAKNQLDAFITVLNRHNVPVHSLHRLECYDISHTSGTYTVGSMVVFTDGVPDSAEYRRFRIKLERTPDDFASLAEMLTRRFGHPEWPAPDLLIVDGGKPQVRASRAALEKIGITVPLIGIAKRNEELIVPKNSVGTTVILQRDNAALQLIQRIRDETHRYGIRYHRLLRTKAFESETNR